MNWEAIRKLTQKEKLLDAFDDECKVGGSSNFYGTGAADGAFEDEFKVRGSRHFLRNGSSCRMHLRMSVMWEVPAIS